MSPFDRTSRTNVSNHKPLSKRSRRRKAAARARANLLHERLEGRAMMAIFTSGGGPVSNYTIIASDQADDVYVRQTVDNLLQVANNSSFIADPRFNYEATTAAAADILYVTNGTAGSGPGPMFPGDNTDGNYQLDPLLASSTGYTLTAPTGDDAGDIRPPSYDLNASGVRILRPFPPANPLPGEQFQMTARFTGQVSYDGATWEFELDPDAGLVFRRVAGGNPTPAATPLSGGADLRTSPRGRVVINWSAPVATVPNLAVAEPPTLDIVNYFVRTTGSPFIAPVVDALVLPSTSSASFSFTIPATVPALGRLGGIIPGSFRATATIDGIAVAISDDFMTGGTLYFDGEAAHDVNPFVTVSGTYGTVVFPATNTGTVTISLSFSSAPRGPVIIESVNYLAYVEDPNPNAFTVFAGHDLTSQLFVDYTRTDNTVNLESNVLTATPGAASNIGDVVINATNVNIKSQVVTQDQIAVDAETVLIDAAVVAPSRFDLVIENDESNDNAGGPVRGSLRLSPSGSLSGALAPTLGTVSTPTGIINVLATQSDVYAEGVVYGTKQDWLMRSTPPLDSAGKIDFAGFLPFELSTRSPATGVDTGLIRGGAVAIVLGNDAPTPLDGDIAYNTLDLNTQVDSIRIKAATRQQIPGPPNTADPSASGPFPYNLSIREVDAISVDAVAASGLPLSIQSGGSMRFTSALATAGDVTLAASSASGSPPSFLTVSAPLSTTRGQIRLVGDGVALNNAVAVTAAEDDVFRDDIWITATAGDIGLRGLVSAVNRIKLEQRSALAPTIAPYGTGESTQIAIPDLSTVTVPVQVPDDFVFDDLDVSVDITHQRVSDLRATLIAPDGRRFRLFDRVGGNGANFTGTIFDSDAPNSIAQGVAPFTGRFSPLDSLAPVYGTSAVGTWRLELVDSAQGGGSSATNFLSNFTLLFIRSQDPQDAKVFGSGRLVADDLLLVVQGSVGNPILTPVDTEFYLRTNVDTLSGSIGGSASIDELNDINVVGLRAPGFVSLRANGPDPAVGRNVGNAALKATLIDITGLDVASPNGSVDVLFDTAKTIELGNAKGLQQGRFLNSTAAGDVSVRSTAGSIVVLDGPVAAGNARRVRVGTAADLSSVSNSQAMSGVVYRLGTPGVVPDTLRGRGNLSAWLGISANALRVGERVLVKNQASSVQNGVYQLTAMSTAAWAGSTVWTLTRAGNSDTAGEMPNNTFVRVNEGSQLGVWQVGANYVVLDGAERQGTIAAGLLDTVTFSAGTNAGLSVGMVVYGPGIAADTTITALLGGPAGTAVTLSSLAAAAVAVGDFKFVTPVVTRSGTTNGGLDDALVTGLATTADLQPGMLVVGANIPSDTTVESIVNGTSLYLSRPATATGSDTLKFIRPFITRSGDTMGAAITGLSSVAELRPGMVVVGDGVAENTTITAINPITRVVTLSQAVTSGLSGVSLKFLGTTPTNFGSTPITVSARTVTTDIGSDDPNDLVTFVVTTTGGTNSAAGSLGKMISLRQENIATTGGAAMQPQKMAFRFSNAIATTQTPIQLTQELPEILSAFTIDGAVRYPSPLPVAGQPSQPIIDGSRITVNRQGRAIVDGDVVDGFRVRGAAAAGASIANVTVGGFNRGAAIEARNAPGVLVNKVTLGINERGDRLANRVGVRFIGGGVTSGGVVDSQVYSSSEVGVAVDAAGAFATNVKVVGTTIGRPAFENALGVRMSSGENQLGVDPVGPNRALPQVAMTRASDLAFTIPSTYTGITGADVGMPLFGPGVSPTDAMTPATIASVVVNAARRIATITISRGTVTRSSLVTFGNVAYTQRPAIDEFGKVISGRDITLPSIVNPADVFLGQAVTGDGIAPNSTITAINGRTVTLSRDMTKTGFAAVTLVAGRRNVIQSNRTGVVLAAGATTTTNTSIISNNFNGLEITGTGGNGASSGAHHRIGSSTVRSSTSNFIHGNGGWGIFLAPPLNDTQKGTQIQIQGNFLGTNTSTVVPAATFSNKKGNIGHKPAANEEVYRGPSVGSRLKYVPQSNGVDAMENQHGIYAATGGGGTGGGGTGGGGGVVPNNPRNRRR